MSFFMPSSVAMVTAAVSAEFHSIPSSMLSSDSAIWVMLPARRTASALPAAPAPNPCLAFRPLTPPRLSSTLMVRLFLPGFFKENQLRANDAASRRAPGLLEGEPRTLQKPNQSSGLKLKERDQNKEVGSKQVSAQPPFSPCIIITRDALTSQEVTRSRSMLNGNKSNLILIFWIQPGTPKPMFSRCKVFSRSHGAFQEILLSLRTPLPSHPPRALQRSNAWLNNGVQPGAFFSFDLCKEIALCSEARD